MVWLSLEVLSRRPQLDPLLTLPVRPEGELAASSRQILSCRPDLGTVVLPMLIQRFPELNGEEIVVIVGLPCDEIRQTRAVQEWLAEGRQEEAASVRVRRLNRCCCPLNPETRTRIEALSLERLETLAEALLDFQGPADLAVWLAAHDGPEQAASSAAPRS